MPTIQQLSDYSQTALAAYAASLLPFSDNTANYNELNVGIALAQATEFNATWAVIQQSAPNFSGFSAVLLQRKDANGNATGEKVLAIAGTDPASPADLAADLGIFINGSVANMYQYMALESFNSQLVTGNKLAAGEQFTVTGHSLGSSTTGVFIAQRSAA